MTSKNSCQLDLCGEKTVDIPDKETLTRLIFESAFRDDFFAILVLPSDHFMQTASSDETGVYFLQMFLILFFYSIFLFCQKILFVRFLIH